MDADNTYALQNLCTRYLRPVASITADGSGNPVATFEPPLTAPEQIVFARLLKLARSPVPGITPAEWQALEPDITGYKTWVALPSPTQAQTVLAVKALGRIVAALIRS